MKVKILEKKRKKKKHIQVITLLVVKDIGEGYNEIENGRINI